MRLLSRNAIANIIVVLTTLMLSSFQVEAQKRIALIIGNGSYTNVQHLENPVNDTTDVAGVLGGLGFEVISGTDFAQHDFADHLKAFGDRIGPDDEVFFFYAGHGLQAKGVNYLIPVDARLDSERDLDFEAIPLDLVLRQMRSARTKIIYLMPAATILSLATSRGARAPAR